MRMRVEVTDKNRGELLRSTPEDRMKTDYDRWLQTHLVTYTNSVYESASRAKRGALFETINPINDTKYVPDFTTDGIETGFRVHRPKNVRDENVLEYKAFLFEMDGSSLEEQETILRPLYRIGMIQRVVYSGNKSLHVKVVMADSPTSKDEYTFCWNFLNNGFFRGKSDGACKNPSRTTRSPFAIRKDEKTGGKPVEQKLLYFADVESHAAWREAWKDQCVKEAREWEASRRRAAAVAAKRAGGNRPIPNEWARLFIAGDQSDGWKHEHLGSAIASLKACGYSREDVDAIFRPYKKELRKFAMHAYGYFERKDAKWVR
jgi:hypothetical protein